MHQDGEPVTFVHLIERVGVRGGVNIIAPPQFADQHPRDIPQGAKLDEFTIEESLESYAVVDAATNRAVGVASYLRIDPANGSIEVGHINRPILFMLPMLKMRRGASGPTCLMAPSTRWTNTGVG